MAALTLASGGSPRDALLAFAISFAQIGVYNQVGNIVRAAGQAALAVKVALHAIVGGAFSLAQGGSFQNGAITGGVAGATSFLMEPTALGQLQGDGGTLARTAVAAASGGTASVLSGGKFANGAITGAMGHLFNQESSLKKYAMAAGEVGASMVPGVGEAMDASVLFGSGYSAGERVLAGVSLVANIFTGGLLPNLGGGIRAANHFCSFDGDTRVQTKKGRRAIKDIQPGEDEVLSRDERTGKTGYKLVSARFVNRDGDTTHLTVRDRATGAMQTITTTANHPFYVADAAAPELRLVANGGVASVGSTATGRWVDAGNLAEGDRLMNSIDAFSEVVSVTVEDQEQDAYNLEVEDFHTFFVAAPDNDNAPAVWVHNSCPLGLGNVGHGGPIGADDALSAGAKWVGDSYKEMAPGVYRSADGQRQFRMTTGDLTPTHGNIGPGDVPTDVEIGEQALLALSR